MNLQYTMVVAAALLLVCVIGCSLGDNQPATSSVSVASSSPPQLPLSPSEYVIEVHPELLAEDSVKLDLSTNITGTIEVMAGLSLRDQKADDVAIGKTERVRLVNGRGSIVIQAADLPRGTYDAEASFYPRWGFQDDTSRSTGVAEAIHVSTEFVLAGDGETAEEAQFRRNAQKWVMSEVGPNYRWNEKEWTSKYGAYQQVPVTDFNPKIIHALYFPRLDMTIFVNTLKSEVSHWRIGRASQ